MGERVIGIDVSRYQGDIDWSAVARTGITDPGSTQESKVRFAVIRATIGDIYTDPRFFANWKGAKEAGLLTTAYHVVRYDADPEAQVEHFIKALSEVSDYGGPDLPLVLDVELPSRGGSSVQHHNTLQNTIAMENSADLGKRVIIYTGAWWWDPASANQLISWVRKPDLWTASYTDDPILPSGWCEWHFWQYTNKGTVPGISGNVDVNQWNGDYQSLLDYSASVSSPEPEPPAPEPIEVQTITIRIEGSGLKVEVTQT